MTAIAITPARHRQVPADLDRAGLAVCEAELRYKLRWNECTHGSLLALLDELERAGLVESAIHFRLTDHGRGNLPDNYEPPSRYGSAIRWEVRS
jgi:DNA-binding PadR family transcriptional regulator